MRYLVINILTVVFYGFFLVSNANALTNTNFYVADKSESCYPDFLGVGGPTSYPDKESSEAEYLAEILDYQRPCQLVKPITQTAFLNASECVEVSPFKDLKSFTPNSSGSNCGSGKACYCKLKASNHLLPLKCIPSNTIENYETCSFSAGESSLSHKTTGCSGGELCYRIPQNSTGIENIRDLFKQEDGSFPVTITQLTDLSTNNGGICLPHHTCQSQQLGHNMVMESQDVCAFGSDAVEEIDGENVCINPAYKSEIKVPDSIEFHVDNNSCSIFAVEMFDGVASEDPMFQNLFLPLPDGKLRISPALIKYANFERYLLSLQWLWGSANSKHVTSPSGQIHERINLGRFAKNALAKFDTHHRYIHALKAYELNKIKNEVIEEISGEGTEGAASSDPLIGLRAQIDASKKLKNILPLEIKNYRLLLGGSDYISELGISDGSKSEGSFFNEYKNQSTYKTSLAYLKDASSSLSASMWERKTKSSKSCPSRWALFPNRKIGCRKLNGDALDCKPIPGFLEALFDIEWLGALLHLGTLGTITIFSAINDGIIGLFTPTDPKLVNIKLCIDESIVIEGSVSNSNNNLNGKLINPIYPNDLLSNSENVNVQSSNINSFGKKVKITSKDAFKEVIMAKYSQFINSTLPQFTSEEKNKVILFLEGESLLDGSVPSPDVINGYLSSDDLTGLKRQKVSMTALEYMFYKKSFADPENLGIYVDKSDVDDFKKDNENHDEVIKNETLNIVSQMIYDHFIRMHFSRKQNQYHTSEVVGGAGFYNFNMAYGDHGETLGYMKELYSMAEYIYKYQQGLENGYNLQINCLEQKLTSLDNALGGGNHLGSGSASSGPGVEDVFFEFSDGLGSLGLDEKEIQKVETKLKKSIKPNIKNETTSSGVGMEIDETLPESSDVLKKNGVGKKETSTIKKDKKLAKNLSDYRKKKIERLGKINKSKKAQLISTDDILKEIAAPAFTSTGYLSPKNRNSKIDSNDDKKAVIKKAENSNKKDPFLITKVAPKKDKNDDFKKTKYRLKKGRKRRSKDKSNSDEMSLAKKRSILKGIRKNKNLYENSNDDTLFERVSKTYIRAAYPVLLRLK